MLTIEKKIKFSKGEINSALNERTDISLLDGSASYIKNYIANVYGGLKTRFGTDKILKLDFISNVLNINNIHFISNYNYDIDNIYSDFFNISKLNISYIETTIEPIFEDVIIEEENLKHLVSFNINSGTKINNPIIQYTTDKQDITTATFEYQFNSKGELINIIINGDFYYKENYNFDFKYEKINLTNFDIYINNNLIYTYQINFNEEFDFSNINIGYNVNNLQFKCNDKIIFIINNIDFFKKRGIDDIKILPFIYNKDDKSLIILTENIIYIVKNDIITTTITLTKELSFDNLKYVKYSQFENTIIFTETTKKVRRLIRKNNEWYFDFFELKNIPYHCFNDPIIQTKNINITPSDTSGNITITADNDVFEENYVGQIIDGGGGRVRITTYMNKKKVGGYTIIPFYTKDKINSWTYEGGYELVFSDIKGYPNTCLFYQERLFFGGSTSRPLTLWASRINDYNNFLNVGNYDNDAIDIDIATQENSEIVNLYGARGIQIFTEGAEFVINENRINPNTISVIQASNIGSRKETEPKNIAGQLIFVETKGRNIYSFLYDFEQQGYRSTAISLLNNKIIKDPIGIDVCFNANWTDGNLIFIVNNDGTITLDDFISEQGINAFTRMENKDIYYNDCISLIDDVYFINIMNNNIYLSKLNKDSRTDNTIIKNVVNTNIITNLDDYNNLDVRLYYYNNNNLIDLGIHKVINNQIILEEAITTDKLYIGLDIECKLISNNIYINNRTNDIKKRIAKAVITTSNENEKLIFNDKETQPYIYEKDKIYNVLNCNSFNRQCNFNIKSTFYKLDLKSIVLTINYGE